MNIFKNARAMILSALLLPLTSISAHEYRVGDIVVDHPWARPLPSVSVNGAAYIKIHNMGESDRLVSARSPAAEHVEVHTHLHENGVMKMRKLEGLDVPKGETVMFKPGGLHLMLLGLTQPLVEGESFPVTLQFEKSGALEVVVKIEQPEAMEEGAMKHEGMDHGEMKHDEGSSETMDHSNHSN